MPPYINVILKTIGLYLLLMVLTRMIGRKPQLSVLKKSQHLPVTPADLSLLLNTVKKDLEKHIEFLTDRFILSGEAALYFFLASMISYLCSGPHTLYGAESVRPQKPPV